MFVSPAPRKHRIYTARKFYAAIVQDFKEAAPLNRHIYFQSSFGVSHPPISQVNSSGESWENGSSFSINVGVQMHENHYFKIDPMALLWSATEYDDWMDASI